jgi:hypothetical protein
MGFLMCCCGGVGPCSCSSYPTTTYLDTFGITITLTKSGTDSHCFLTGSGTITVASTTANSFGVCTGTSSTMVITVVFTCNGIVPSIYFLFSILKCGSGQQCKYGADFYVTALGQLIFGSGRTPGTFTSLTNSPLAISGTWDTGFTYLPTTGPPASNCNDGYDFSDNPLAGEAWNIYS